MEDVPMDEWAAEEVKGSMNMEDLKERIEEVKQEEEKKVDPINSYKEEKPLSERGTLGGRVILASQTVGTQTILAAIKYYERTANTENNKMIKRLIKQEVAALEELNKKKTQAVVTLLGYSLENVTTKYGNIYYIITEFLPKGTLFDLLRKVFSTTRLTEAQCAYLFGRLVTIITIIHKSGIFHLDIKLENFAFADNGELKLIDFGHSRKNNPESGMISAVVGTPNYQAPEISRGAPFSGRMVDVFSLGIILFAMHFGYFPFRVCNRTDPKYLLIIREDYETFWQVVANENANKVPKIEISEELKQLITGMIIYAPEGRLTIGEISFHPWLTNTEACSVEEILSLLA